MASADAPLPLSQCYDLPSSCCQCGPVLKVGQKMPEKHFLGSNAVTPGEVAQKVVFQPVDQGSQCACVVREGVWGPITKEGLCLDQSQKTFHENEGLCLHQSQASKGNAPLLAWVEMIAESFIGL